MALNHELPGYLSRIAFPQLLAAIKDRGYRVVGPSVQDGAIVYDDIHGVEEFPEGYVEKQTPGSYQLEKTDTTRWFHWTHSAQGLKPFLFKPREYLWQVERDENGHLQFKSERSQALPLAFIGARACDLQALAIQDAHFIRDRTPDPFYSERRAKILLIGVNCSRSAVTCFCAATGDGPKIQSGFDLCLTELEQGFLVEAGSSVGKKIVSSLQLPTADESHHQQAEQQSRNAAAMQIRTMPSATVHNTWLQRLDATLWDEVAARCLACGNCTSVCPTCFCHSELEDADISGNKSHHYRQWSSCFTQEHSYMHGIVLRDQTKLRYRQWFTHKLAGWHEQYGRSGCVGCGRCITWCPVGIDITEVARLLVAADIVAADTQGPGFQETSPASITL